MRRSLPITGPLLALLIAIAPGVVPGWQPATHAGAEPTAVIVTARSKVNGLTMGDLSRIFRGMPARSADGHRYVPLNAPPASALRVAFDQAVLSMTADQNRAFWIDQKLRAVGTEPRMVSSVALATKLVSLLAGAITYVPVSALNAQVKAVRIDSKLPSDPGYALR